MFWFKNIFAFQLDEAIDESALESLTRISEASSSSMLNIGWTNELNDDALYQVVENSFFLKLQIDKKSVPPANIKIETEKEIKRQIDSGIEKPNKKEIKENVTKRLAEKVLFKTTFVRGYIDNKNKLLVIDSGSQGIVDQFTAHLRKSLGTLKISMFDPEINIVELMTGWLSEQKIPNPFGAGEECSLVELETGSKTKYTNQDLFTDEIQTNLENGKVVSALKLDWHERFMFSINEKMQIKSIKTLDAIEEQVNDDAGESGGSPEEKEAHKRNLYIASMILMKEDFAELLRDLQKLGK